MKLPPSSADLGVAFFSSFDEPQTQAQKRPTPYRFIKRSPGSSSPHPTFQFTCPRGDHKYFVCLECIIPQVTAFCNGKIEMKDDEDCPLHEDPLFIDVDTSKYSLIRSIIGVRSLVIRAERERLLSDDDFRSRFCDRHGNVLEGELFEALCYEIVHTDGCLHSETPEAIVSGAVYSDVGSPLNACVSGKRNDGRDPEACIGSHLPPECSKGNIASDLFFKHCDGKYRNAKGETLHLDEGTSLKSSLVDLQV